MTAEASYSELRQTSADTPGGDLLRRMWLPIAARGELTETAPVLGVKVLGDALVLFRTSSGEPGLMQGRCPHNGYSLVGSSVSDKSLVCWKHGWHFGVDGACWVEGYQGKTWPVQWANASTYPLQTWGGLLWSYLGESPASEFVPPPVPAGLVGIQTVALSDVQETNWVDSLAFALGDGQEIVTPCMTSRPGLVMLRLPVDDEHTWMLVVGKDSDHIAAKAQLELTGFDVESDAHAEARGRVVERLNVLAQKCGLAEAS
jgi:nitrite reductase/ring-hydroxylating ferredoxin subunit